MTFETLAPQVRKALEALGHDTPTTIQEQAIPVIQEKTDLIAISHTGTGKSGAVILPILDNILNNKTHKALIVAPTRELAVQLYEASRSYAKFTNIKACVLYGGAGVAPQKAQLKKQPDIIIATPGRLLDIGRGAIKHVDTLVLDEADRMLDMGFIHDIKEIKKLIQEQHHTILCTATMNKQITQLAQEFLRQPERIDVRTEQNIGDITEHLYFVEKKDKYNLLETLLGKNEHTIIFTKTKHGADNLTKKLISDGKKAAAIHGNKTQAQRTRALKAFTNKQLILVATDVAARGIDVEDITQVINYDLPQEAENYTHRIGRTGRAGKSGVAHSFCDETQQGELQAIQKQTKKQFIKENHPYHSEKAQHSRVQSKTRFGKSRGKPYNKRNHNKSTQNYSKKTSDRQYNNTKNRSVSTNKKPQYNNRNKSRPHPGKRQRNTNK